MKKIIYSFTLLFLIFFGIFAETSIAVLNFKSDKLSKTDLIAVNNLITTELSKIGGYRVISWDDVEKMLEHEASKQILGCGDTKCIAEIGSALGVDYIMAGDIGGLGTRFVCNLKVIDINKAETKSRVSEAVTGDIGLLIDKIPNMVRKLLSLPLSNKETDTVTTKGNSGGIAQNDPTVTDIDGNVYHKVENPLKRGKTQFIWGGVFAGLALVNFIYPTIRGRKINKGEIAFGIGFIVTSVIFNISGVLKVNKHKKRERENPEP